MLSNVLDRISFWSLFIVVVLLPVFFLPFVKIPVDTSKGLLLVAGLVISIITWAAARFSDGKIVIAKSPIILSAVGVLFVLLFSTIFSQALKVSFFGTMFDLTSFWFIFSGFLLMFMSSIVFKDKERARKVLFGVLISSLVVFIFQVARIFIPDILSFGVLGGKTNNLVGSWNSFGLLAGLVGIVSLFVVEFFELSKSKKWLLGALVIFSMIIALLVNFFLLWELLGIFALLVFVYKISISANKRESEDKKAPFPIFSFVVVMISLLFFMSGQFIGGYLPGKLGLSDLEVNPSFVATMQVTKEAIKVDPLLGIGPNRFEQAWSLYKPVVINNTAFWNTSFSSGSGLIPTFAATTGILGIISWIVFFVLLIIKGIKMVFVSIKKGENSDIAIFLLATVYLFVAAFFYTIASSLLLLAFAFTGIFVGIAGKNTENGQIEFSFLDDPRKSFFSILLLVLVMIFSAGLAFKYVQRLISVSYFTNSVLAQDIKESENNISRAILLHSNDLYLRTYSQIYLAKLNTLVSKNSALTETEKAEFQSNFDQAVSSAVLATKHNPLNYLNFQILGSIYRNVVSLGVEDAFSKEIESYTKASELNPKNPGLKLAIASAYYNRGSLKEAREFTQQSLDLKPDYIDALITLSQIEKNSGNTALAVEYAQKALLVDPTSKDLVNYLNSLKGISSNTTQVEDTKEKTDN